MTIETKPFDAAKYFSDEESQIDLITDAFHEGHPGYIAAAIGTVAKVRGIATIAAETGLSRQALHRALSEEGNPTLDTLVKVLDALGLQLEATVKDRVVEAV